MKIENIKTSALANSPGNPIGNRFDGPAFNDLVASVKERGILVPLIIRPHGVAGQYEVVAGHRRLAAAEKAGLKEVPAQVRDLSDDEAREIQIIENLQRQDVHPLDEGEAYRSFLEISKREIKDIAAKVGKSETYVRQRLLLTNLMPAAAKAYRNGDIIDGHAVLIARLSPADQAEALKYATDEWDRPTVKDLEEWIQREFADLKNQPWLAKANEQFYDQLPAHEKGCGTSSASLFGDVQSGSCTDTKCWQKHMDGYVLLRLKANPELVPIYKGYGKPPGIAKLSESEFKILSTKAKEQCDYAQPAIVSAGNDVGSMLTICSSKECKKHSPDISATPYKRSKKEVEAEKKRQAAERARERAEAKGIEKAAAKVKVSLGPKASEVLLELAIQSIGFYGEQKFTRANDLEVSKGKRPGFKAPQPDHKAAIRGAAKTDLQKVQMAFRCLLSNNFERNKLMKKL